MAMKNLRLIIIVAAVPLLLLIPFFAMQFTTGVNWTAIDFAAAGIILLSTGLSCELVLRTVKKKKHRLFGLLAVLFLFFLVWAELAVGVFGTPWAGS